MTVIPQEWMPAAPMKRIIIHWTAGAQLASENDREHYHFLVEGDLDIVRGTLPVTANVPPLTEGKYAAHTRGSNSHSIGISICGMNGAVEQPFNAGKAPISAPQFSKLIAAVACLATRYSIPVTDKTILTHAEVQKNLGIKQNGKWDITRLPFDATVVGAKACGDKIRSMVKAAM